MTRRQTVDWVLGRAATGEPGVDLRYGVRAEGLLADAGDPPRVRGCVRTTMDRITDVAVMGGLHNTLRRRPIHPTTADDPLIHIAVAQRSRPSHPIQQVR